MSGVVGLGSKIGMSVGVLLVVLCALIPTCKNRSELARNKAAALSLATACDGYRRDHGGAYPESLLTLEENDFVEPGTISKLAFQHGGASFDWKYVVNEDVSCRGNKVLFVAPLNIAGKLVVGISGGQAKVVEPSELIQGNASGKQ